MRTPSTPFQHISLVFREILLWQGIFSPRIINASDAVRAEKAPGSYFQSQVSFVEKEIH